MRWMLDTDICIFIMKHHPPQIRVRLRQRAHAHDGTRTAQNPLS